MKLYQSILLTLNYASYFHSQPTLAELHRFLISPRPVGLSSIQKSVIKNQLKLLSSHSIPKSQKQKLRHATRLARFLSIFPSVTLVALTGSLALDKAKKNDDIDIFIVTKPHTLWLTRLLVVPLVSLFSKRRHPSSVSRRVEPNKDRICFNLWLDQTALAVPKNQRNLYTAHEVLQIKPLLDRGQTYARFIIVNSWTRKYLANAYQYVTSMASSSVIPSASSVIPSEVEGSLPAGRQGLRVTPNSEGFLHAPHRLAGFGRNDKWWKFFFALPNLLAFKLQYGYMKKKITREVITLHSAYFHPRDLSTAIENYLDQKM
ncbi:nucleotidyltransferase domain-containing protein [Candidatus Collierbacteria bacterium]|nr:nucleotidyltransferase domain-containing protein [Candidatus Collierbacteria bacterium]